MTSHASPLSDPDRLLIITISHIQTYQGMVNKILEYNHDIKNLHYLAGLIKLPTTT